MEENTMARLVDGFYKPIEHMFEHWEVNGDKIELRDSFDSFDPRATLAYGDFGGLCQDVFTNKHFINSFSYRRGRWKSSGRNWKKTL